LHRDDVGSQFGVVAVLGGPRVRICAAERVEYWGMLLLASVAFALILDLVKQALFRWRPIV